VATYVIRRLPYFTLLLILAGCGFDARANPVLAAMARHHTSPAEHPAVVFRFDVEQGDAQLYTLPRLSKAAWQFHVPRFALQDLVGFSRDADQIYLLSTKGELVGLDLGTGRASDIDSALAAATLGPTGTLHFVRTDGSVGAIDYRTVSTWPAKLEQEPTTAWGGASDRLLVLEPGAKGRELVTLSANQPPVRQPVPQGAISVSPWGDVAVIAVDSGLMVLDPAAPSRQRFRKFKAHPDAVAFSPSEYEIYVAVADQTIAVLDRYSNSLARVARIALPARASALRPDPLGRLLLVHSAAGDSTWVLDLATRQVTGTIPGAWRDDLPAVAPDGTILTALGQDVVAQSSDSLTVQGRVRGGAADRWLAAAWDARRPALQLASDTSASHAGPSPGGEMYVQVSSTSNRDWAEVFAHDLRVAGLQASVLQPSAGDDRFRVVLGPFPTREAAEAIGRKLGRPFWIFTREAQDQPQ
jgi:hypothetical protein